MARHPRLWLNVQDADAPDPNDFCRHCGEEHENCECDHTDPEERDDEPAMCANCDSTAVVGSVRGLHYCAGRGCAEYAERAAERASGNYMREEEPF